MQCSSAREADLRHRQIGLRPGRDDERPRHAADGQLRLRCRPYVPFRRLFSRASAVGACTDDDRRVLRGFLIVIDHMVSRTTPGPHRTLGTILWRRRAERLRLLCGGRSGTVWIGACYAILLSVYSLVLCCRAHTEGPSVLYYIYSYSPIVHAFPCPSVRYSCCVRAAS